MNFGIFEMIFGLVTGGIGCAIGILGYKRTSKKDDAEQIRHDTKIDVKLDTIAKNVDETRLDIKDFNKTISGLSERVTKVEESTKQAHKRIDGLEELHLTK